MVVVQEYFEVQYGVDLELNALKVVADGINFVSRTSKNNGVVAIVKEITHLIPNPPNTISVAASGSVMESFLQESPYYSGRDLFWLKPKIPMNRKQMLFYCMCLRANNFRFNYGRQANKSIKNINIPTLHEMPDYVNNAIMPVSPPISSLLSEFFNLQKTKDWKEFFIKDLFKIQGTDSIKKHEMEERNSGSYPYVTATSENNAVSGFYDFYAEDGGVITIDSAATGFASYQARNFSASGDVKKLIPRFDMNSYLALFFVTLMNMEKFRYNYARKAGKKRLEVATIKLPTRSDGYPDYNAMERYIKSLPFSATL